MGTLIKDKRKSLKFTQDKLAKKVGVSRQYYADIENFNRVPSVRIAKHLAVILQLDWTIFFDNDVNI